MPLEKKKHSYFYKCANPVEKTSHEKDEGITR